MCVNRDRTGAALMGAHEYEIGRYDYSYAFEGDAWLTAAGAKYVCVEVELYSLLRTG